MQDTVLTDRELLRKILFLRDCTQAALAEDLGVDQSVISKVVNKKLNLRPATRRLAERLLEQAENTEE